MHGVRAQATTGLLRARTLEGLLGALEEPRLLSLQPLVDRNVDEREHALVQYMEVIGRRVHPLLRRLTLRTHRRTDRHTRPASSVYWLSIVLCVCAWCY